MHREKVESTTTSATWPISSSTDSRAGAIRQVGNHLLVERLERVGDQRQLVGPVPVDRRLADAGSRRHRLDRDPAVADLRELVDRRAEITIRERSILGSSRSSLLALIDQEIL